MAAKDNYSGSLADKFRKAFGAADLDSPSKPGNPQPEAHPGLQSGPPPAAPASDQLMEMWERVDKSRAIKGLPSLPKPGTKAYRE
jgi:hypothetical protein